MATGIADRGEESQENDGDRFVVAVVDKTALRCITLESQGILTPIHSEIGLRSWIKPCECVSDEEEGKVKNCE